MTRAARLGGRGGLGGAAYFLPSLLTVLLGFAGIWLATNGLQALTDESAKRLRIKREHPQLPAFVLQNMNGQEITIGGTLGQNTSVTLVEFIYTTCPTICKTAGSSYGQLRDRVEQAGLAPTVRMLSVSFDPQNDTIENLKSYAELHKAAGDIWTIARINAVDIERIKRNFGLRILEDEIWGYQHNTAIHMINANGQLSDIYDIDDIDSVFAALSKS